MRERPGLAAASSSESNRYEELLVNQALVTLARQGEIDCGGLRFLVVGYGSFHQLVVPTVDGRASVAFGLGADPVAAFPEVRRVLAEHGLVPD